MRYSSWELPFRDAPVSSEDSGAFSRAWSEDGRELSASGMFCVSGCGDWERSGALEYSDTPSGFAEVSGMVLSGFEVPDMSSPGF